MVADGSGFVHRFVPQGTAPYTRTELRGRFAAFHEGHPVIPGDNARPGVPGATPKAPQGGTDCRVKQVLSPIVDDGLFVAGAIQ